MPAKKSSAINLNLLKPQSNPEKILARIIKWLLSTGRFIFVFVEAVVLLAFIYRFKLDADIASRKEQIDEQIPYIESLKPTEIIIRQTQLKLSTIGAFNQNFADYPQVLNSISTQTPIGVKITSLSLSKEVGKINVQINAQAQSNNDLVTFLLGLREDQNFSNVNLTSVGLEQGVIRFTITATAKLLAKEGKTL